MFAFLKIWLMKLQKKLNGISKGFNMNKNKKEFMFDMEVFFPNILEARRGIYFFFGSNNNEALNNAFEAFNAVGLRIKKIYSMEFSKC